MTDSSVSKSIQCSVPTAFLPKLQECDGGPETDCFDYNATQWRAALVKYLHAWGSDAAAAAVGDVYEVESKWHQRKAGRTHQNYIDGTRPALLFVQQFTSYRPWSSSERPLGERIFQAAALFNYHHCHHPP